MQTAWNVYLAYVTFLKEHLTLLLIGEVISLIIAVRLFADFIKEERKIRASKKIECELDNLIYMERYHK